MKMMLKNFTNNYGRLRSDINCDLNRRPPRRKRRRRAVLVAKRKAANDVKGNSKGKGKGSAGLIKTKGKHMEEEDEVDGVEGVRGPFSFNMVLVGFFMVIVFEECV
ncbi:hypothetical protein BU17DRAFT_62321 [Hysterangium stoloniferum]|nr:hypothetical protein BU17DRAFT_62321 [Hysterangium stoloniferum]